jgi:hypothetical protein
VITVADDRARVAELLGRAPMGEFEVVVRSSNGDPAVLRNDPILPDGTPMPTLYWLCDPNVRSAIGTIESDGGVRTAEAELGLEAIAAAHAAYAAERDQAMPDGHQGPAPYGGVGGTREGLKCLHAHYAHWLAGGDDPVGEWTNAQLIDRGLLPIDAPKRVKR